MSSRRHVSHCKVLPLVKFTVTIPEPHAILQGVRILSAILKIVFRYILFSLGFDERRLSYRLRYTCYICRLWCKRGLCYCLVRYLCPSSVFRPLFLSVQCQMYLIHFVRILHGPFTTGKHFAIARRLVCQMFHMCEMEFSKIMFLSVDTRNPAGWRAIAILVCGIC